MAANRPSVQMDYEAVLAAAAGFENAGELLKRVSVALEAALRILQVAAFVGIVGAAVIANYINNLKPRVDKLAGTCTEMAGDLRDAERITREKDEGMVQPTFRN